MRSKSIYATTFFVNVDISRDASNWVYIGSLECSHVTDLNAVVNVL